MKGLVPALFHRMHEAVLGPMEPGMDPRRVKSHSHFILEASVGQITYTLTTGVFMTGFALYLGASDNLTGIIASIPMLMNVLQVVAALLMERVKHKKRVINLLNLAYRSIMSLAIFIPLLLPERWWVPAFVAMNVLGFLFCSVLSPSFNDWMMGLTLPRVRGRFFARREAAFQAAGMAASLIMGVVVDAFHKTYAAFLIPYLVAFACGILDYIFISGIEEPVETKRPDSSKRSMKERLMGNRQLFEFAGIWVLWYFGYWMAFSYFSVFMVSTLGLSYSFMTVQNTVQVLALVLSIGLWGRYAGQKGWPRCLLFTCVMVILGFFTRGFVTRELYLRAAHRRDNRRGLCRHEHRRHQHGGPVERSRGPEPLLWHPRGPGRPGRFFRFSGWRRAERRPGLRAPWTLLRHPSHLLYRGYRHGRVHGGLCAVVPPHRAPGNRIIFTKGLEKF